MGQEGERTGIVAQGKRTQRRAPGRTRRRGKPQQKDQHRPTRSELKPVRTPVAIFGSLGVCIYGPASRHWLISYSPFHLT